uniref:Transmembrane protein 102 n=1 Tax=Erpetoichthys calabaricus TaxID=27687 RepID=A0A8C4SKW0_ERPCA
MASLINAVAQRPSPPGKMAAEFDFRSGANMEHVCELVLDLVQFEQREFDDQTALEVHTAKDFIFSMLGVVQKIDQRLPIANEYLLLSGGTRDGVLDLSPDSLGDYAKGADYDLDFTLLVPALKLHDRNQPVTLDMRHSTPCHSWLSLRLCDRATLSRWQSCCKGVQDGDQSDGYYFSPTLVVDWFSGAVLKAVNELRRNPQRGTPVPERVERNGPVTTLILTAGTSRILYDLVPVVSFRGWPAVAQGWLMENHFWDGKITEEEVISGFYLLPCCSPPSSTDLLVGINGGSQPDKEWRLAFSRSEVQLKKCIPLPLAHAFQAAKAIISKLLARPKAGVSPYHLRTLMFWACDRLPSTYLSSKESSVQGGLLLGLLDDLAHALLNKSCPNYFLPQCNMFEHLSDTTVLLLARKLACVRSDPVEHLRTAIEQAKVTGHLKNGPMSAGSSRPAEDDRLAKRLQQLVTENPGKSISVFLNPEDVSRPHFRIDDKFY